MLGVRDRIGSVCSVFCCWGPIMTRSGLAIDNLTICINGPEIVYHQLWMCLLLSSKHFLRSNLIQLNCQIDIYYILEFFKARVILGYNVGIKVSLYNCWTTLWAVGFKPPSNILLLCCGALFCTWCISCQQLIRW